MKSRSDVSAVLSVWSHLKRSLANLVKHGINQLNAMAKTRLKRTQHRTDLIEGFLAKAGLDLAPP
ncbi:hypothetical protein ACJWDR_18765 [Streptomyces tauricus]|uniref:hypothetical protein n=1 Tax=Streptomyces tauricus TaxID=68274 RepID=UPI00387EF84F